MANSSNLQPDDGLPLFTSFAGKPINFRIVGSPKVKARYTRLIMKFGGTVYKNSGVPRLNIVHGGMPCEEGHQDCSEHPQCTGQPLFLSSWVDDCISANELLNISCYLMNRSPEYTKIDFMKRLESGYYAPAILSALAKRKPLKPTPSYRILEELDMSNPTSPHVASQLKIISSYVHRIGTNAAEPVTKSSSPAVSECQKENDDRGAGPLSSSTPAVSAVVHPIQSLRSQRGRTPPGRRRLSPAEKSSNGGLSSILHQNDEQNPSNVQTVNIDSEDSSDSCLGGLDLSQLDRDQGAGASKIDQGSKSGTDPTPPAQIGKNQNTQPPQAKERPGTSKDTSPPQNQNRPVFCGITYSSSDSDSPTAPPPAKTSGTAEKNAPSSESEEEFGPPPGAIVRLKGVQQNTRAPYSHAEEIAIIKYILAGKKLAGLRSNVVWKQMDGKPGVERRTWQSLREHFLKKMVPKLERFNLTKDQIKQMRRTSQH